MARSFVRSMLGATAALVFIVAFLPAQAQAQEFGIANFEAGTCSSNVEPPTPIDSASSQCTYASPESMFFTQAAGHPNFGIIDFRFNTDGTGAPIGHVQNIRTDLPRGISVNPEAVPKCTQAQFDASACPPGSKIGENYITVNVAPGVDTKIPPVNVYNMVPPHGQPLMAGMSLAPLGVTDPIYFIGDVEWDGDYHQFFTISDVSESVDIVRNRLVFDGRAGIDDGPGFIRMPTTCIGPQTTILNVAPHGDPDNFVTTTATTPVGADGCENVPFGPQISVTATSSRTDSPTGATIEVEVPDPPGDISPSDIRHASVTLPAGMTLNASAVNGLGTCTNAQFGKGTRNPIRCPASSRIGSVAIETPGLPEGSLRGNAYVGQPLSSNPASGQQFRLFMEAGSERFGVSVRLIGAISVHPQTGRLTTTLRNLPQAPSTLFTVRLDGGPRAVLATPPTCGPHTTNARFVPWTGQPATRASSSFTLSQAHGGVACAATLARRPFSPDFRGRTNNRTAGQFTNLAVTMTRRDGEQEFKGADVTLPAGMVARLAGVPYCSEQAIAAAGNRSGAAERASASCPDASWIARVGLAVGTGSDLYSVMGNAYLAGPYKGAPLSAVAITPAIAGPYDLGTEVVRVALHVDPVTLEVRALSDPIPHRVRGVDLRIRSIIVAVDRDRFNLNPTGCWEKFFRGALVGGGGNPNSSSAWSSSEFMHPYQATNCDRLGFAPRMVTRMFGNRKQLRRNSHPVFRAVVRPRPQLANIRKASVRMPRSIQLDQSNIRTVCTRDQFAADECPRAAIYGIAVARSPLLDRPVRGPVYLRSSDHMLPDLVASLRGQVKVELAGRIDSARRMIRTVYTYAPDVPVTAFALQLRGGPRRGLLVTNRNLCGRAWGIASAFQGHNLKVHRTRSRLMMNCRPGRAR